MTQIRRFTGWNLGLLQTGALVHALLAPEVTVEIQHLIKPSGADVAVAVRTREGGERLGCMRADGL